MNASITYHMEFQWRLNELLHEKNLEQSPKYTECLEISFWYIVFMKYICMSIYKTIILQCNYPFEIYTNFL